jgi:uncharacterized protein YwgA
MYKSFLSALLLLFLAGCKEDFPTYSTFENQEKITFNCLHYAVLDLQDRKKLENVFHIRNSSYCPYRVELTKYYVGNCNNPVVKSVGGDFNGYVRVEVKKGFKCYYKAQSDFKDDAIGAFKRVLKRVKIDFSTRISTTKNINQPLKKS